MTYDSPMRGWKYCFSSRNLHFPLLLPHFLLHLEGTSPTSCLDQRSTSPDILPMRWCGRYFNFKTALMSGSIFVVSAGWKHAFFFENPQVPMDKAWRGVVGRWDWEGWRWWWWWLGGGGGRVLPCVRSKLQFHSKEPAHTVNKFLFKDSCFPQLNIIDFHN